LTSISRAVGAAVIDRGDFTWQVQNSQLKYATATVRGRILILEVPKDD
jgi:hypothetical protein